jgi:hypothetical protein
MQKTIPLSEDDKVILTRFINNKLYKVSFKKDILVRDVASYWNLSDENFIKASDRKVISYE